MIIRLTGKHADLLAQAAIKGLEALKDHIKTITFDNGLEFSEHEKISQALDADIYFAHPGTGALKKRSTFYWQVSVWMNNKNSYDRCRR